LEEALKRRTRRREETKCGRLAEYKKAHVEYTRDVDCSAFAVALDVRADDVFITGNGHAIRAGGSGVVLRGAGISVTDLSVRGGDVGIRLDGASLALLDALSLTGANVGIRGSGDDILLLGLDIDARFHCVDLAGVGDELTIFDSTFRNCATGVRASFRPGASLTMTDNALRSSGGAVGLVLVGLDDALPLARNTRHRHDHAHVAGRARRGGAVVALAPGGARARRGTARRRRRPSAG
jgi:hypothetical protein